MRILLINPEKLIQPPFGLLYIGSTLKASGHEVEIFEIPFGMSHNEYLQAVNTQIRTSKPAAIGITCMSMQIYIAKDLVKNIKENFKDIAVIVGGVHSTIDSHDVLSWGTDIAVRGEGEKTILEIVDFFDGKQRIESINGISYKNETGIFNNPNRELMKNLEEIPPLSYELLNASRFQKRNYAIRGFWLRCGWVMTSRGCPGRCIFCGSKTMHGRVVREFTIKRILDEMERLKNSYRIEGFWVVDDNFTLKENRVIEFCRGLKERKLNFLWGCQGRVDTFTEEMAKSMKSVGCVQIDFGVESGSQKVLDNLNKGIKVSDTKRAFQICKNNKIRSLATVMIGSPEETKEDIKLTKELLGEIKPSFLGCFFTTPFPGTELNEMAIKNKWIDIAKPIQWQTMEYPVMSLNLTEQELKKEFEDIQKYNRNSIYKYLSNPLFIYDMAALFFKNTPYFLKILYFFFLGRKRQAINSFLFLFRKEFLN